MCSHLLNNVTYYLLTGECRSGKAHASSADGLLTYYLLTYDVLGQVNPKHPAQMARISQASCEDLTTVTKSESIHGGNLGKERAQGGAPDSDEVFDSIKTLLAELRAQMQCDAILFVPSGVFVDGVLVDSLADSGGNKLPQLLSTGSMAKARRSIHMHPLT